MEQKTRPVVIVTGATTTTGKAKGDVPAEEKRQQLQAAFVADEVQGRSPIQGSVS